MFDTYSAHHVVWFIVITIMNVIILKKHAWIGILALIVGWEIFEWWVSVNIPNFPFVGKELWINKFVGDTISDLIGVLIAITLIKFIRNKK